MSQTVFANDPRNTRRRVFLELRGTDGISLATGETGGQPSMSIDGAAPVTAGVSTLVLVNGATALYYTELTQAALQGLNYGAKGTIIYKSANTDATNESFEVQLLQIVDEGVAQSGAAAGASVVLQAGASATDNRYAGATIDVYEGTGAGDVRDIDTYVGSTKTATPSIPFTVQLDNTSRYVIYKSAPARDLVAAIWQALIATYGGIAGSFGEKWSRLLVDGSGNVSASNVATAPTTTQIAAAILATPTQKIATNASGQVTASNPTPAGPDAATIATAVLNAIAADEQWAYTPINNPALVTVTATARKNGVLGQRTLTFAVRGTSPNQTYELCGVGVFS